MIDPTRRDAVLSWLQGRPAAEVAATVGVSEATLAEWRDDYFRSKLPNRADQVVASVDAPVQIRWDTLGIPHIRAESDVDAFFGLGYAMAQERLWQLDYQRRLVRGELAAIFGPSMLSSDRQMRLLGIGAAGDRAWDAAPPAVRAVLEALAAGINTWLERVGDRLPVEFEVLGYAPRPWRPADSIAVWKHRWWLLTGRLEATVVAEMARRNLPPDALQELLSSELSDETIVGQGGAAGFRTPGGSYAEGSNNWTVAGSHTTTGHPVLCSDPHNQFFAPSQWFEAQVTCPDFDAAGAFYIGTPTLYLGRNRHVAWGLTNHAVSIRDLYVEEVRPEAPNEYRDGSQWRPFEVERQRIPVANGSEEEFVIRRTVRGPIVNEILPLPRGNVEPPISLRWYGSEAPSGFEASLALLRARSADDVLDALRQWPCPPLNYVYATTGGEIGYHAAGFVPRRKNGGVFFRRANDPDDEWDGFVPFDDLPHEANPSRGWVATANNVPWQRDEWYLSLGNWSDGYRARRIRERLTAKDRLQPEEIAAVHGDVLSIRARDLVPALLDLLGEIDDPVAKDAVTHLRDWDHQYTLDSVGATVWTMFWTEWCETIVRAWFPEELVPYALNEAGAVARRLLVGPPLEWFRDRPADQHAREAFHRAVGRLVELAGSKVREWHWGRLHQVEHPHPMASLPGLRSLYNVGPYPTTGGPTVRAAGFAPSQPFACISGSTYRFVADLSRPDALASVQTIGQSAHLGSPHYRDQVDLWLANQYHPFWMSEAEVTAHLEGETVIQPSIAPRR